MAILHIEKLGGLANFGGPRSRIRSRGKVDTDTLSAPDLKDVDLLFSQPAPKARRGAADEFRYRITRGDEVIEVPESRVPRALASSVKDELV